MIDIVNAAHCSMERHKRNTLTASALATVSLTRDTFLGAVKADATHLSSYGDEETRQILKDLYEEISSAHDRLVYLIGHQK